MENDEEARPFNPKDMFWTDYQQANERLSGTVVLYDNEPVLIESVRSGDHYNDAVPRAIIRPIKKGGVESEGKRKRLDSPKFNKYRDLPALGFINPRETRKAIFLSRKIIRSRQHGLSNANVTGVSFAYHGRVDPGRDEYFTMALGAFSFEAWFYSEELTKMFNNEYPALNEILAKIEERDFIAYSRNFAVYCDTLGIKWLYRQGERIGFFTSNSCLTLLRKFRPYREEITEDKFFTIDTIAEI